MEDVSRSDIADDNGMYRLSMPWYEIATYAVEVRLEDTVVYREDIGPVLNDDQSRDLVVSEAVAVTVSGMAKDATGDPVGQVLVTVARPEVIGGSPDTLVVDDSGDVRYQITNSSGVFLFEGVFGRPLLDVGFSPDFGFGYLKLENPSQNSGGDLTMPSGAAVNLRIRLLSPAGEPVVNAVLPVGERFAVHLEPTYDLSSQIAALVADQGLFGGLSAQEVVALHPAGATVQVQSTDADGIADQGSMLKSGLYQLSLTGTAGDAYDGVLVGPDSRLIDAGADTIEVKIPAA